MSISAKTISSENSDADETDIDRLINLVMSDFDGEEPISIQVSPKDAFCFAVRARKARQHLENKSALAFHDRSFTNALERHLCDNFELAARVFDLMDNPPLEGTHQTVEGAAF